MKVRIPFVVGPNGRWCAYGYPSAQDQPDWSMVEEVADNGDEPSFNYQRGWIEVDLPEPPAEVIVAGSAQMEGDRGR